ncbi:hypothetical protein BC829DRAFT_362431, partial [Chytridium lagenaria]
SSVDPEDKQFDDVVGVLEDILMDDEFVNLQTKFLNQHFHHFSNDDENKFIYMGYIYTTKLLEKYIDQKLRQILPWFCDDRVSKQAKVSRTKAEGEVFEMLTSLGDFNTFKEVMLDFKSEKEGTTVDLSGLLAVSSSRK